MKVNARVLSFMKEQYYPPHAIRLLQKAALAPLALARVAWCEWRDLNRLDFMCWQERKILARMHNRIPELDPEYVHLQRVIGITKSEWALSSYRLNASLSAVDLLLGHGFNLMLFKGLPWDKRFDRKGIRLSGDLDILVPEVDFISAVHLLRQKNWVTEANTDLIIRGVVPDEIHGINFTNIHGGNIDIHRRPSHSIPNSDYLERLWAQSEEGVFMGRYLRYCSHADYLALLVDHGVGKSFGPHMSSIWPIDLHQSLTRCDAGLMADFQVIIKQLRIPLQTEFALRYCTDVLKSSRIAEFSQHVKRSSVSIADVVRSILNSPPAFTRGTPLWLLAGSIRRISRYMTKLRYFIVRPASFLPTFK